MGHSIQCVPWCLVTDSTLPLIGVYHLGVTVIDRITRTYRIAYVFVMSLTSIPEHETKRVVDRPHQEGISCQQINLYLITCTSGGKGGHQIGICCQLRSATSIWPCTINTSSDTTYRNQERSFPAVILLFLLLAGRKSVL